MSLLMDALRKAEDAKRQVDDGATQSRPEAPELTLAPLDPAPAATPPVGHSTRLPELAEHSAALDAELSAVAAAPPRQRRPSPANTAPDTADAGEHQAALRATARNVFAAKTAQASRRGVWLVVGLACVVAVFGIGAYFWWQLQAVSGGVNTRPQAPAASAPAAPTLAPTPVTLSPAAPKQAAANPPPAAAATTTPPPDAAPAFLPRAVTATSARAANRRAPTTRVPIGDSPGELDAPLRLSSSRPSAARPIERAFAALQSGELDTAQHAYEQVLRGEAKNTDAWLGLATIAARRGQSEQAQAYYLRALETDPSDPTAQAGLLNSRGQSDPALAESRLKSALAAQPESSALLLALGNLYARQARWNEAQQAYFRAYAAEPDNADIIFNLAVSLDHLRQNKLAAQYYQMALSAAQNSGARPLLFDSPRVSRRIEELQP